MTVNGTKVHGSWPQYRDWLKAKERRVKGDLKRAVPWNEAEVRAPKFPVVIWTCDGEAPKSKAELLVIIDVQPVSK